MPLTFSCHFVGSSLGMKPIRVSPESYCIVLNNSAAGRITSVLLHRAEITAVPRNPY